MRYGKGQKVKCKVTRVLPPGVSVKLPDGSRGWIRKRELSWFHDTRPTSSFAKLGDEIDAVVVEVDEEKSQILLSLREVDNPWVSLEEKLKPGSLVEGVVTKLYTRGAYVFLPVEGVEGYVPFSCGLQY